MFISKKDLDNLENKIKEELRQEFDGRITEVKFYLEETLRNWTITPKKKKTE